MASNAAGFLLTGILLVSIFQSVYPSDIDGCPAIRVKKNRIIRTKEALNSGAKYLRRVVVQSARECYKLCCEQSQCNLGMLSYKNSSNGQDELERMCYLFDCGSPSKCHYSPYDHYAIIEFEDGNQAQSVKDDHTKSESHRTKPTYREGWDNDCPPGAPVAMCKSDPCNDATCPGHPWAVCQRSTCGTCHAEFLDDDGQRLKCYGDLYNENHRPVKTGKTRHGDNQQSDKSLLAEIEKMHQSSQKNHKSSHQMDLESHLKDVTKKDPPTHQVPSGFSSSPQKAKPTSRKDYLPNSDEGASHKDSQPEHRQSETNPIHNIQPSATDPPFHHWREFIDNNPKYGKAKLVTEKPTTEATDKKPQTFHQWREFIDNNPKYKHEPNPKTTPPTKPHDIAHTKPAIEEIPITNSPPRVDHDSGRRNISDVVVIETNHVSIVENKAVVPLAIFLVVALVMLFVVGLRLRLMKNRLRRKAFATDDADYLINGMYL